MEQSTKEAVEIVVELVSGIVVLGLLSFALIGHKVIPLLERLGG